MGTTPEYAYPYPEATGLVKDGASNIQALAEAIDTSLVPSWLAATGSTAHAGVTSVTVLDLDAVTGPAPFTNSGGVLTYTGSGRLFIVSAMALANDSTADADSYASLLALCGNGAAVATSRHAAQAAGAPMEGAHTHTITWLAYLNPGDTIHLEATGLGGAVTFSQQRLILAALTPA